MLNLPCSAVQSETSKAKFFIRVLQRRVGSLSAATTTNSSGDLPRMDVILDYRSSQSKLQGGNCAGQPVDLRSVARMSISDLSSRLVTSTRKLVNS